MKAKYDLTEKEIEEAIADFVNAKTGGDYKPEDVHLRAEQRCGQFDQPEYAHTITATVG